VITSSIHASIFHLTIYWLNYFTLMPTSSKARCYLSVSCHATLVVECVSITYEMEPASVLLIEANVANRRRREDEKKEASEQDDDSAAAEAFIAVSYTQ
jgi:hypothetical protein